MTPEEAKKMVGTEFIYEFEDGDEILAYVKAFDPEEHGLTCYTLETMTRRDKFEDPDAEEDGTWCVIGGGPADGIPLEICLKDLEDIKNTGRVVTTSDIFGSFVGCTF